MATRFAAGLLAGCLLLGMACPPLQAVIISTETGIENTTAPTNFPWWDNIVRTDSGLATATYLGNRWVMTANHSGARAVTLNGTPYQPVPGSTIRMVNPDQTLADIIIYRINGDPGLPSISLANRMPAAFDKLTLIGAGYDRQQLMSYWKTDWTPTDFANGYYSGYLWDTTGRAVRWGTNIVDSVPVAYLNVGGGPTQYFRTNYSESSANTAQAAPGDSGGPVFLRTGTGNNVTYQLIGMILGINTYEGQPSAAVFGNQTDIANLYAYRGQLMPLDGDANLDGVVDQTDYTIWYNHYGSTAGTWATGDFNSDRMIDQADYTIWYNHYGGASGLAGGVAETGAGLMVPEPATMALLLLGGAGLLRRKRP